MHAITLQPRYAWAHMVLAGVLTAQGRFEAALTSTSRAIALDSVGSRSLHIGVLILARRYGQAVAEAEAVVTADPTDFLPRFFLALAQPFMGQHIEGIRHLERLRDLQPRDPWVLAVLGVGYAWSGLKPMHAACCGSSGTAHRWDTCLP